MHGTLRFLYLSSLRSRRLEVAGERENGRARGRHARGEGASFPLACLLLARPFFLVPTTSKRLLRRLVFISPIVWNMCENIHYESVYFKELHNQQEYY